MANTIGPVYSHFHLPSSLPLIQSNLKKLNAHFPSVLAATNSQKTCPMSWPMRQKQKSAVVEGGVLGKLYLSLQKGEI